MNLNNLKQKLNTEVNDFHEERYHAISLLPILIILILLFAFGHKDVLGQSEDYQFPSSLLLESISEENKWDLSAPYLKGGSLRQQEVIRTAWEVSGGDKEFILMLAGENGLYTPDRQSDAYQNGIREDSWGFCQIHRHWHSKIVDDPRFFTDEKWQLEQCFRLWKGGTPFYGYNSRWLTVSKFNF